MAEAPFYPMLVSLEERVCVVVGGGAVGERKVRGLLPCRATVHLVATRLSPWLEERVHSGEVCRIGSHYEPRHLDGADLVFAATDDRELNRRIAEDARLKRIWCNMATDPDRGSFIVPSVFRQGPLTVAFSTGGLSPALAKRVREQFEEQFDVPWALALQLIGRVRPLVQAQGPAPEESLRIFRELARLPISEWLAAGEIERIVPAVHEICGSLVSERELHHVWEEVWNQSSWPLPPSATAAAQSDT